MAGIVIDYAGPGTGAAPVALPMVFRANQHSAAIIMAGMVAVIGVPAAVLHPVLGLALFVSAAINLLPVALRPPRDYVVLGFESVFVNGIPIPRREILACVRGLNGYKLCLHGGSVHISLLEIRRKDLARLEHALREYFGTTFCVQ